MSIPATQTVQYYTTRDVTPVAIAQKSLVSSASGGTGTTETVVPVSAVTSGTTTSFHINADTLQLIGLSGALPNSNLFVNYPHTMWERDAEGNRIPIQVTATGVLQTESSATVKAESQGDPLSQAAAVIKNETASNMKAASGSPSSKTHLCDICTKGFAKREHLTKHIRIHKDTKRYSCEFCQKQFRDRYELVRHQRRHTGDFPFRCNDCSKGFMRHERYMTHLRFHSGERPFQCVLCEKSFRDRSELNRHSRRHTGDLPYKCATCGKGFLRRERFITHVRIHTGEKPFVCGGCSRGYRDKRELRKHQATHNHGDPDSPSDTSVTVAPSSSNATVHVTPSNNITIVTASPPVRVVSGTMPAVTAAATKAITVTALPQVVQHQQHQQQHQQQQPQQQQQQPQQQQQQQHSSQMATITFTLPTEPVPKNQLGISQPEPQLLAAPLNPAQIQLPPSVATALQNMNQRTKQNAAAGIMLAAAPATPVKQEQLTQFTAGGAILKQIQGVLDEGTQITLASGSFPGLMAAGGTPQVFYYVMPSNVQPFITDGTGTLRGATADGGATTQFVALPAGALQATVPVSTVSGFPQWIIDSSQTSGSGTVTARSTAI